jgi:hypothetical protein
LCAISALRSVEFSTAAWASRRPAASASVQRDALELVDGAWRRLRVLRLRLLQRQVHHLHHRGGGQGLLRRKVLVEAGLGDADFGRHLVDRHQVEALFGQQALDGGDDRVLTNAQHLLSETTPGHAPL